MKTDILLESGTNELEILEFIVGNNHYGINVAKVKEILTMQPITPIPNAHPCIEGMFMPRGDIITVMNLFAILGFDDLEDPSTNMLIVTNFNNLNIAFRVQQVLGIHRVSWTEIVKPDVTINANGTGMATGIITRNDSLILEAMIQDALNRAGYTNLTIKANGQEAWDVICTLKKNNGLKYGVQLLITDIEMPLMDGHHLVKLVREDDELKDLPIIIFSSLINDDMKRKGEHLGANAQVSKPEIGNLVHIIDQLVGYDAENDV